MLSNVSSIAGFLALTLASLVGGAPAPEPARDQIQVPLPGRLTLQASGRISEDPERNIGYFAFSMDVPGQKLGEKELDNLTSVLAEALQGHVTSRIDVANLNPGATFAGQPPLPGRMFVANPTGKRQPMLYGLAYVFEGRIYLLACLGRPDVLNAAGAEKFYREVLMREGWAFDRVPPEERRCPTGWLLAGPHPHLPGTPVVEVSLKTSVDARNYVSYAALEVQPSPQAQPAGLWGDNPTQVLDGVTDALVAWMKGKVTEKDLKLGNNPGREFNGRTPFRVPLPWPSEAVGDRGDSHNARCAVQGRVYLANGRLSVLLVGAEAEADVTRAAPAFFDSLRIKDRPE